MSTTPRISTLQSVQNILNSRKKITEAMVGSSQILRVRGNGNELPVTNKDGDSVPSADGSGAQLFKKIFNLVCNSEVAIKNPRNQEILRAGYAAEQAGNTEEAAVHYNDFLNKVQVSINVLSTSGLYDKIQDGDEIRGTVQKITTANGSILTLDSKTLAIKQAGYAAETNEDLFKMLLPTAKEVAAPAETTPIADTVKA